MAKLALLVPYRDRKEHLDEFLPGIREYFSFSYIKEKNISGLEIHICEQDNAEPFNKGRIINAGFVLSRQNNDYFCIHDVDYIPLDADYSRSLRPARLIWQGLRKNEDYDQFFGAVVLLNKADFVQANGFSNEYWGWGFEDTDLALRLKAVKRNFVKRDGVFKALEHSNSGLDETGKLSQYAMANRQRFFQLSPNIQQVMAKDGLSSLKYSVNSSMPEKNIFWHRISW